MYAVIFKAEIKQLDRDYYDTASRMQELAKSKYGCVEFLSLSEGQREIAISYWPGLEQISAWRQDPEHVLAQEQGRSKWYQSYEVEVVRVERAYAFPTGNRTGR